LKRIDRGNAECAPGMLEQSFMREAFDFVALNEQDSNHWFRRPSRPAAFNDDSHATACADDVIANAAVSAVAYAARMRSFARLRQKELLH
jgi:hypothetical protein